MKINEVIIVEGKDDTKRLKSFFDVDTIETHGLGIKKEIIEYIKEVNNKRGVILLLDPDSPGEKIRKIINDNIPNLKNAFLNSDACREKGKVGIEYASKEAIEDALNNFITYTDEMNNINIEDLYKLGLLGQKDSTLKRNKITDYYHIGKCNGKTLLKRINMLKLSYNDIEEVLNDSFN